MACTWLTCDCCGRDYLVPDAWVIEMDEESDIIKKECDRCRGLSRYYWQDIFEMEKAAYRAARRAE